MAARAGTGRADAVRGGAGAGEPHGRTGLLPDGTGTGEDAQVGATVGRADGTGTGAAVPGPPGREVGTGTGLRRAAVGTAEGPVVAGTAVEGTADGATEAVPSAAGVLAVRDAPGGA